MFHVINIQGSFLFVLLFQNCLLNIYRRLTAIRNIHKFREFFPLA